MLFGAPVPIHYGSVSLVGEAFVAAAPAMTIAAIGQLSSAAILSAGSSVNNQASADILASAFLTGYGYDVPPEAVVPTALLVVLYKPTARLETV
jgi:hypothetical protein